MGGSAKLAITALNMSKPSGARIGPNTAIRHSNAHTGHRGTFGAGGDFKVAFICHKIATAGCNVNRKQSESWGRGRISE